MPLAPNAAQGFFPLDEELALLPGTLTPSLQADMVRLGARMPFRSVVQELAYLKHVTTTEATVRRHTEAAGAAYVALQTEEVERIERTTPAPPRGAARQLLSADGALVPLRHGEWAEVKTVAIGEIQPPILEKGEAVVHTTDLSYFSRLAEHATFTRLATVETQRRGTERAEVVCAVNDGAEWIQGFVDVQRHDASFRNRNKRIFGFFACGELCVPSRASGLGRGNCRIQNVVGNDPASTQTWPS